MDRTKGRVEKGVFFDEKHDIETISCEALQLRERDDGSGIRLIYLDPDGLGGTSVGSRFESR